MDIGPWAQVVTWLLVLAGWFIINHQHNERETRKEIRSRLDNFIRRVYDLERKARAYHRAERADVDVAQEIKLELQRLGEAARQLRAVLGHPSESDLATAQIGLRRAVTLRNFDSADHRPVSADSQLLAEIADQVNAIIDLLETAYTRRFLRRRSWRR